MGKNKSYIIKIIFIKVFAIVTCCSYSMQALALNSQDKQIKTEVTKLSSEENNSSGNEENLSGGGQENSDKQESNLPVKYTADVQEFSDEYKKWLELSDEEKENAVQPSPYYTSYYPLSSEENKLNESFSLARRAFNAVALSADSTYDLRDHIDITVKNQLDTL